MNYENGSVIWQRGCVVVEECKEKPETVFFAGKFCCFDELCNSSMGKYRIDIAINFLLLALNAFVFTLLSK